MTNPLTEQMLKGAYGELYAQIRLLEHYVQCAIPQEDTGNDFIAIKNEIYKSVQVKTTIIDRVKVPDKLYDILMVVKLNGDGEDSINLETSKIFILTKEEVIEIIGENRSIGINAIQDKILTADRINEFFPEPH